MRLCGVSTTPRAVAAELRRLAANAQQRELVNHLEARERHLAMEYDATLSIVNKQIRSETNLAAS